MSPKALAGETFEIKTTFSNRSPKALAGETFKIKTTFSDRSPKALAGETFQSKTTFSDTLNSIRNCLKQISAAFVTTLDISNECAMTNPEQIHSSGMQVKWKQP